MAFDLSFSPEFFMLPGELDGAEYPHGDRPYSVRGAILAMPDDEWALMCTECFGVAPEYVSAEAVLEKIQHTNTCTDLRSPVTVWIDADGWHSVDVYDREGRPEC